MLLRKRESLSERSVQKNSRESFLSLRERLRILSFWDFEVDIIINIKGEEAFNSGQRFQKQ